MGDGINESELHFMSQEVLIEISLQKKISVKLKRLVCVLLQGSLCLVLQPFWGEESRGHLDLQLDENCLIGSTSHFSSAFFCNRSLRQTSMGSSLLQLSMCSPSTWPPWQYQIYSSYRMTEQINLSKR